MCDIIPLSYRSRTMLVIHIYFKVRLTLTGPEVCGNVHPIFLFVHPQKEIFSHVFSSNAEASASALLVKMFSRYYLHSACRNL